MKKFTLLLIFTLTLMLVGCSSEAENSSSEENSTSVSSQENNTEENKDATDNLFDSNDIEEGYWIGQSGQYLEAEEMIISNPIQYDSNMTYEINNTSYITYMHNDEVLETRLHDGPTPREIDSVEEANHIRISFDNSKLDGFQLIEK